MASARSFKAVLCTAFASAAIAASPAAATTTEDSAPAAASAAPVTGAVTGTITDTRLDSGQFRTLFGEWKQHDGDGALPGSAPAETVSMPQGMPVEGVRLSSGYGMRNHPVLRKRANHKGVDLAGARGTPVYATADGTVEMAQWFSSYGKYVQIDHGGDVETRYAHLSRYTVNPGDRVQKGELIGYIGSTGRSTGPHLHYEIRIAGVAVDPTPYMITNQYALNEGEGGMGGDD
ncbi:M23 family metallopeptidase [Paraurantiacibacter namhicola]|uniref:Murein DD-endopeptidase MepM n=1 Tax=Paraurantiacibacter namhicola TaxID=645517 RepID=A0A1C7D605_9SPHN|nr:M23 family metallopeptidase [Paraurantiacibacter namhicola]ANU06888.1 Murein DD-endopeptidase MepM [Paraurantiacibacter namhicola]